MRSMPKLTWPSGLLVPERSAPEQNAPPAPPTTNTRSARRLDTSSKTRSSSDHMVALIAFFFSGRLRVSRTTPASRVSLIVSKVSSPIAAPLSKAAQGFSVRVEILTVHRLTTGSHDHTRAPDGNGPARTVWSYRRSPLPRSERRRRRRHQQREPTGEEQSPGLACR